MNREDKPDRAIVDLRLARLNLALAALHFPVLWLARNTRNQPDYSTVALAAMLLTGSAFLLAFLLQRTGLGRVRSSALVSVALMIFWYWPSLVLPLGVISGAVAGGLLSALLLLMAFVYGERLLLHRLVFVWGSVTCLVGAGLLMFRLATVPEPQATAPRVPLVTATQSSLPDIYIVVFDGLARPDVLASLYGFDAKPYLEKLTARGFEIAEGATANYSITHLSLASMFSMSYPLTEGSTPNPNDFDVLEATIEVKNPYVTALRSLGYNYVHGGHGWWGTDCENADLCLETPGVNQTLYELLSPTPLGSIVRGDAGSPATRATLRRIEDLKSWDSTLELVPAPRLVVLHLGIPHPPLYLNDDCHPAVELDRGGNLLASPNDDVARPNALARRRAAYVEQVECAFSIADLVVRAAPPDAVILFVSDHGPDSLGQLLLAPTELDQQAQWERMSIFLAVRGGKQCNTQLADGISLINVLPTVTNCVLGTQFETVPDQYYIAPPTGTALPLVRIGDPDNIYSPDSG